jgi:hypothetical protein
MRRLLIATVTGLLATGATTLAADAAPKVAHVTSEADGGAGSLREALATGAEVVVIDPSVETIVLSSTLERSGATSLRLQGNGVTIEASGVEHALPSSPRTRWAPSRSTSGTSP